MTALARCMRRYDANAMLVLADLCEERELFESARKIRNLDSLFIAYLEMYRVRQSHRRFWPCATVRRFPRWSHNPKPWKEHTRYVCNSCGHEYGIEREVRPHLQCIMDECNGVIVPVHNSRINQPYAEGVKIKVTSVQAGTVNGNLISTYGPEGDIFMPTPIPVTILRR